MPMATASGAFRYRKNHRKQLELEEARKSGLVAPEIDEDGKEINPHIPQYMSSAPWYLNAKGPSLKHQRNWKSESNYDAKRDRWSGYDTENYARDVVARYEARDEARRKFLKEQLLKKIQDQNDKLSEDGEVCDGDDFKIDEAMVDQSNQMDFAKVQKRVRTTSGGTTGTVRCLRIREDTAKYLLNLDVNSAYYNPKSRSMREDPRPDTDPNENFYQGDNQNRISGQAQDFKLLNVHAWKAFYKGQDIHPQAAPSQAEILYRNYKVVKEKLMSQTKNAILDEYGNVAAQDKLPRELLLGQSESQIEYDLTGRIVKGQEMALPRSKYEEDDFINNHTSVWGSCWKDQQWG